MKREAVTHTKMKRLCRRLDIPQWQGVGLVESLWQLTSREAPRGDIGKLSNEDIALAIGYHGDEARMIEALVLSRWVDQHPIERLIIHDWHEHCEDSVHVKLARTRQYFASGHAPKLTRLSNKERAVVEQFYEANPPAPPIPTPTQQDAAGSEDPKSAQNSDPCAQNEDLSAKKRAECAQNGDPCALPLPLPLPRPLPVSDIHAASPDQEPAHTGENAAGAACPLPVPTSTSPRPVKGKRTTDQIKASLGKRLQWWEVWWKEFPCHEAMNQAMDAFDRKILTADLAKLAIEGAKRYADKARADPTMRLKFGQGWLNDERWKDESPIQPRLFDRNQTRREEVRKGLDVLDRARQSK